VYVCVRGVRARIYVCNCILHASFARIIVHICHVGNVVDDQCLFSIHGPKSNTVNTKQRAMRQVIWLFPLFAVFVRETDDDILANLELNNTAQNRKITALKYA